MTSDKTMLEAGKQIAAIASGRARKDNEAEASTGEAQEQTAAEQDTKLTALPNESTVETANEAREP